MVRVCKDLFPNPSNPDKAGFYMEESLKDQLDILLKNITKDWDFTIIISGQGEVRLGKSMIAAQIGCYWNYMIEKLYGKKNPFNIEDNYVFDGKDLIRKGNELGTKYPYSALIFDEAGADLEGRKVMQTTTQLVMDYLRECGQYNMLNILVLPEFFDLPKGIAISRSCFLIDVYYSSNDEGIFERGYYNFFSRRQKKMLYIYGKRDLNYYAVKHDLNGRFYKFFPLDEKKYKLAKLEALKRRECKKSSKDKVLRDAAWYIIYKELNWTQRAMCSKIEALTGFYLPEETLRDALAKFKYQENDEEANIKAKNSDSP